jgi:hypothetical protein
MSKKKKKNLGMFLKFDQTKIDNDNQGKFHVFVILYNMEGGKSYKAYACIQKNGGDV